MGDIRVIEGSDPLLTIRVKKKLPEGGTTPYTLNSVQDIEFYVKSSPDVTDANAEFIYKKSTGQINITDEGLDVDSTYGEMSIQCAAADLTPPVTYYFHLDVIKGNKRDTVKTGFFVIENV